MKVATYSSPCYVIITAVMLCNKLYRFLLETGDLKLYKLCNRLHYFMGLRIFVELEYCEGSIW